MESVKKGLEMNVTYRCDREITTAEFIDVLNRSTLGQRRPVDDEVCIADMLKHADLLCTAWDGEVLIGVARSVTDFSYCCYLSDLAVDVNYQHQGIGKSLIHHTRLQLGQRCSIILLAAPAAVDYYPKLGFSQHHSAWLLTSDQLLK